MNPVEIDDIEEALGFKFSPIQREIILSKADPLVLCWGRKSGKTQALASKIVYDGTREPDGRILITAKTEGTAKEMFRYVQQIITLLKIPTKLEQRLTIILENGHTIECVSPGIKGYALRPRSYNRIYIDEASFMDDETHDSISPCLAVKGKQEIVSSTPWDTSGFFHEYFYNLPKENVSHVDSTSCSHIPKDFLDRERRRMGKDTFDREYKAVFMRASSSLINDKVLYTAIENFSPYDIEKSAPIIFLGVDFARFGRDDNAIVWCAWYPEIRKAYIYKAEIISSRQMLTSIVGYLVGVVRANPRIRKVVTDSNGVGAGATDLLVEKLGKNMVLGIANQRRGNEVNGRRKLLKEDLYTTMICGMEENRLKILDDRKLIFSLRQLRYDYTQGADLRIFGKEDHLAEASVRAVWCPLAKMNTATGQPWLRSF